jgi:hypothetical protein
VLLGHVLPFFCWVVIVYFAFVLYGRWMHTYIGVCRGWYLLLGLVRVAGYSSAVLWRRVLLGCVVEVVEVCMLSTCKGAYFELCCRGAI